MFEIINHKLFEMKKSLIVLLTLFSCILSAQSIFFLHGVKISNKDSKAFESIEMEYMSKLAQDEVNAGRMRGWALLKRVPGIGDASDYKFNYFWVHSFDNIDQMVDRKLFWQNFKSKFGIEISSLGPVSWKGNGRYFFKTVTEFQTGDAGKYVILNDGKPESLEKAMELAIKGGEYFEKNAKKHGMTGWGMATTIAPQDMHNESNIFFWDVYDSMSGVMKHMALESVIAEVPNELNEAFSASMPDGFNHRNICEILAVTEPKQ